MSHSSGVREDQDRSLANDCSWFIGSCLLAVSSHGKKGKWALWGLFYNGINPIHESLPSWPETPSKGPTSKWQGIRFQHMNLGGTHSIYSMWVKNKLPLRILDLFFIKLAYLNWYCRFLMSSRNTVKVSKLLWIFVSKSVMTNFQFSKVDQSRQFGGRETSVLN